MKTAQILIVGDEILSGRTADTNSAFLAKELFKIGARLQRIHVIGDNLNLIAAWIHQNHGLSDYVFVCGGIGGTPDDMTREAVARGVGVGLHRHPEADRILKEFYGDRANAERMSMADLPEGCTLIPNSVTKAPGFKIRNIYVMAGVPSIMKAMFEEIRREIQGTAIFETELKLQVGEGEIARFMKKINLEFPQLDLGSYPTMDPNRDYKTLLVFKSSDQNEVNRALIRFKEMMGES